MIKIDYNAELARLMTEAQGDLGDAHEIHMRLKQTIASMRAEGLPVPEDFKYLDAELDAEFEARAKDD